MDTKDEKTTASQVEDIHVAPDQEDLSTLKGNYQIKKTQASRFAAAIAREKPSPFSKSLLLLYPIFFVAFMNSAANGFDGNTFGGVSALPDFEARFGTNVAASQGFLAALYILGNVIGSFVSGPLAGLLGRRRGMFIANVVVVIGTIAQAASNKRRDMIAGRIVLEIGSVMLGPSAQAYTVEISHPAFRGVMMGLYNGCYFIGVIVSTWLEYGLVNDTKGETNWRLPMAMQACPCVIVLIGVFFIPESPRWLMSRGLEEQAHRIRSKYHGENNPEHEIVQIEMDEMSGQINTAGSDKYMPLTANSAGVTSTKQQLLMNALQSPIMAIGTILGVRFIDKAGRRPMLIGSSSVCTFCVMMVIICEALRRQDPNLGLTGIAFVYVFLFAFAFVWTPCQALYRAEVLAYNARGKGLAMSGLWLNIVSFINTYSAPVGITQADWRSYFLYFGVDFVGISFIYFFFVETKGRSLEEIDEIFADPHPVKASLKKQEVVVLKE